jgi:hypothetical protein
MPSMYTQYTTALYQTGIYREKIAPQRRNQSTIVIISERPASTTGSRQGCTVSVLVQHTTPLNQDLRSSPWFLEAVRPRSRSHPLQKGSPPPALNSGMHIRAISSSIRTTIQLLVSRDGKKTSQCSLGGSVSPGGRVKEGIASSSIVVRREP